MSTSTETVPTRVETGAASNWAHRVFAFGYLGVCAVAMIGWTAGLGWITISVANRLLF
jgi:hypothetical protein